MSLNTTKTAEPKDGDAKGLTKAEQAKIDKDAGKAPVAPAKPKSKAAQDASRAESLEQKDAEAGADVHQVNTRTGEVDVLKPAGSSEVPATPAEGMRNEVHNPGFVEGDPNAKKHDASLLDPASDDAIEMKLQQLGKTAPRLTPDYIQSRIMNEEFTRLEGTNVTICTLTLRNGHMLVGVNEGPISAANFDQNIGADLAYRKAVGQIWPLEGYLLREWLAEGTRKSELNPVWAIAQAVYAVTTAYAAPTDVPAWEDADDEVQQRFVNRVADELAGKQDLPDFPDATGSAMVRALVQVLR